MTICKEEKILIKTEELNFIYEDFDDTRLPTEAPPPALKNVNFTVRQGEYIAVLGHNGSGKSTLAKLLNMILTPTSGKIYIDGKDVTADDITEDDVFEIRKKIGMVFQNPDNQLVANVVEEDVAFGPENLGLEREEIRRRVNSSLALVGMTEYAHHAPHKLSGGQKQRVAIAGIIAMKPKCIIFDESTAMLDPLGRRDVIEIMEKLNREEGITVINITHYMDEASRADRIVVINDGISVLDGTPAEIFSNTAYLHSIGLEAPQRIELLNLLKTSGINVTDRYVDDSECTKLLTDYLHSIANRKSE